jgi:hypothetical protein
VLRDASAGRGRDQRGRRRDVQRPLAIAAGADDVDEVVPLWPDDDRLLADRLREPGDLVRGLAL